MREREGSKDKGETLQTIGKGSGDEAIQERGQGRISRAQEWGEYPIPMKRRKPDTRFTAITRSRLRSRRKKARL